MSEEVERVRRFTVIGFIEIEKGSIVFINRILSNSCGL
jgi:hypothetical protein